MRLPRARSVRARLTLTVAVVIGAVAVAAALAAPRLVRSALIDDLLDAELDAEANALRGPAPWTPGPAVDGATGSPVLTVLFGPELAAAVDALSATGTLDRLRELRADGRIVVISAPGIAGIVETDGRVRVEPFSPVDAGGPIVTGGRLQELVAGLTADRSVTARLEELASDAELSFERHLSDLVDGLDLGDELDPSALGDQPWPPELRRVIEDRNGSAARSVDEYVFGTRSLGSVDVIVAAPVDGLGRSVDRVRAALWIAVPIAIGLAAASTWLLAGRALRPVRSITDRTARIRAGTLHERVPVPRSDDEIGRLALVVNEMLDRLQRDDERRRQFVSDASHELRSPIAAIRTQAEAALAATSDPEGDTAELAAGVLAEADRLGTVVADLLSIARHDEGLAPPGTLLDLDDLVLGEAGRPRRVTVDAGGVSAGRVRGRADELTRVVGHLLDNAARHADLRVAVGLTSDGERVTLWVDDDGPGVPPEHRDRIFERFVRLDETRVRDRGGAGLGLAVVASVVRAAGGRATVETSPLGGARFTVVLPAAD